MDDTAFVVKDIVGFNIKTLYCFGYFSPEFKKSSGKRIYQIYAFPFLSFTYVLCLLSQIANMVSVFGDIEKMTEASFLLLTNTNQALKIYVFLCRGSEVWKFIKSMDREEFRPKSWDEYKILFDEIRISKIISKVFLFMCFVTCSLWGIFPFLDKRPGENIRLPLSGWYPFKTENTPVFELAYAYQIFATWICGMGNISMDTFLSGSIMLISGQLSILNRSFRNLGTKYGTEKENLIENVLHYKNIIQYAEEWTSLFSVCVTSQFTVTVIIICMTMFQMSLVSVFSLQFISMLLYQACILLETFLWCYYGNEVILKSEKLTESAYMCQWISCRKDFKQNLLFFMTRTQFPLKLYAGGYFTLSLVTFMAILKSSWSYFAVLNSVHSEAS